MRFDRKSLLLYAVTDRAWLGGRTISEPVEDVLRGGATFLQLREKDMPYEEFLAEAVCVKAAADRWKVPFVINDNVEIALACGAHGVHVGQGDRAASDARVMLGADKILGVSAQTVEQAIKAERDGADYLGVGAVFPTSSKLDADNVSLDTLRKICASVSIPVVAVGGVTGENLLRLADTGIAGVAVISALFARPDAAAAAKALRALCGKAGFR